MYTVMIPAYREPEVINELIQRVSQFEYPPDRLDVKLLIEADDDETIQAIERAIPGDQFELVLVPPAEPRTKPKALNYGLTLARGELVAIYDAEDEPEPLQLRRAAVVLRRLGPDVACVQAKLTYHNPMQNMITKWFTIEYALWFSFFLPGLASMNAPIPLGGTSNHFRRVALQALGAWDPFNVTEDADLGIRMFREGYSVRVLESEHLRGGQQRLRQLDEAAIALAEGLSPDLRRPPSRAPGIAARAWVEGTSCTSPCSSAARRSSPSSTRSSG